jgi:hypothetical protein
MSRSFKKVAVKAQCFGSDPKTGKLVTSRQIRRRISNWEHQAVSDPEMEPPGHVQDVNRGNKGSKDPDYGWVYWGDGYIRSYRTRWLTHFREKDFRK